LLGLLTAAAREREELCGRQVRVAQEDLQVLARCAPKRRDRLVIEIPPEVDTRDFGAERAADRLDVDRGLHPQQCTSASAPILDRPGLGGGVAPAQEAVGRPGTTQPLAPCFRTRGRRTLARRDARRWATLRPSKPP